MSSFEESMKLFDQTAAVAAFNLKDGVLCVPRVIIFYRFG